jgi:hypothetical protein
MEAGTNPSLAGKDWKEFYLAALLEDDTIKVPQRITEAEAALAARAAELFGASENQVREQQVMENAMYFLQLLRKLEGRVDVSGESCTRMILSGPQPG